jgi:superfamily II DNA or RNA helicase
VADGGFQSGQRVVHDQFGEGVLVALLPDGHAQVFFPSGERRVLLDSLRPTLSREETILGSVAGTPDRLRDAWLHVEAHALPLIDNAAALTAARIDLLPHQVVLTHRIATAGPRRFLVADEVGLGKTIETALILRELASRGELSRALIVVPAGLVNNWHEELNEVFNLDFEVFGIEGDVTDRRSNAFAKHDRLIASIDTLKRPARVQRLKDAPPWDLVVFDEAHHLSAYRNGRKIRRTENYKLAEVLRDHSRDLLLLSATPHQGDHFRFWMVIQLLNPTFFDGPEEMVEARHRLNAVVFRRTKADACTPDGSPLFARRGVHTEAFTMSEPERVFYNQLREYLLEGFDLAKRQGNQGRALGFVMTIFQKIAASSFAAVRNTLRRRQLMLTIHEAIVKDRELDIDGHAACLNEAKLLIHEQTGIADDAVGRGEVDRVLADLKLRLIKKMDEDDLAAAASSDSGEVVTAEGEELAADAVSLALPEERQHIATLLAYFPEQRETKIEKLLRGLGALWKQNPEEKIVIFATYLATVALVSREIETAYPGQGVAVLRGGDHGAKLAAERRFKRSDGPRVLVCTAAGREGINLQFAHILFNFDLPWNPMDVEQRIGRIHRYGQKHTAQVYNLVLGDTLEGRIFLLLGEKLKEIATALGKVDEHGNVTEDLQMQILGQLSDRLSYDELYRNALSDPELKRTRQELESALSNADEARKVVSELFQDLDRFSLEDYRPLSDVEAGKARIVAFLQAGLPLIGGSFDQVEEDQYRLSMPEEASPRVCTLNRDLAQENDRIELLGLDHPLVVGLVQRLSGVPADSIGVSVQMAMESPCVLTVWQVQVYGKGNDAGTHIVPIAAGTDGKRVPSLEKRYPEAFQASPSSPHLDAVTRGQVLHDYIEPMLQREITHRGISTPEGGYSSKLLAWLEVV